MARRRYKRTRRLRKRTNTKSKPGSPSLKQTLLNVASVATSPSGRKAIKTIVNGAEKLVKGKTKVRYKKYYPITYGGVFNIKSDAERKTFTYYKQKVTKQQQRKINRRFKSNTTNPFDIKCDYPLVDTVPQTYNSVKWFWQCHNGLDFLSQAFAYNPNDSSDIGNTMQTTTAVRKELSTEQAIYFNKFKSIYEIFNPSNYDMNVVIYDIVCKKNTHTSCGSSKAIKGNPSNSISYCLGDPISLMYHGLDSVKGPYKDVGGNANTVQVSTGNAGDAESIFNIEWKPTSSYWFNMHWTIVGKKTLRLQPGATCQHTFTYKAKNLMNRGYYAYNYASEAETNQAANAPSNIAIENFTCGTLFKVWGQISGNTASSWPVDHVDNPTLTPEQDNPKAVVNLSGRIMIKEFANAKFYQCNPRYRYTMYNTQSDWKPTDEEDLSVPTNVQIKYADDDNPAEENGTSGD